jgi:DSF synthase
MNMPQLPNSIQNRYSAHIIDRANATYWTYMHTTPVGETVPAKRPCFHEELMGEMREFQLRARHELETERSDIAHFVLASNAPVFSLGGDLDLFVRLIRARDVERLTAYAELCVRGVHAYHGGLGPNVHSIALVQGAALGGGFEAALSCNTIVAEAGTEMGLPESVFGLFPGMGAYQFIRRRVGGQLAQRLIMSGQIYRAEELHDMGLIDVLAPKGEGLAAVSDLIRANRRRPRTWSAIAQMREWSEPVALEELLRATRLWVDTAMALEERSLKTMQRLVHAQEKRHTPTGAETSEAMPLARIA